MTHRAITRVLLSLLLLITQQLAFAHAMSHLTGAADVASEMASERHAAGETAKALAQDQTCSQCLAFAQLATPLGSAPCQCVAANLATDARASAVDTCTSARTTLAFQSRAPPA